MSSAERLDLIDVILLAGEGPEAREVPQMGLHFDAAGLEVKRPDGERVAQIPWASLRGLQTAVRTPKGDSPRVELDVESDRKQHRFVIPNVDGRALRSALAAISTRHAREGLVSEAQRKGFRLR